MNFGRTVYFPLVLALFALYAPGSKGSALGEEGARSALLARIAAFPTDAQARSQLADWYLEARDPEAALRELGKIAKLKPAGANLAERRGRAYWQQADRQAARESFQLARREGKLGPVGGLILAEIELEKNPRETLLVLDELEAMVTPSRDHWRLRGLAEQKMGDPNRAEIALRRALQLDPRSVDLWLIYGNFLGTDRTRLSESEEMVRAALAIDPQHVGAIKGLADIQRRQGRPTAAKDTLLEANSSVAGNDELMFEALTTLEELGEFGEAGVWLARWRKAYPERLWLSLSYAKLLESVGEEEAAKNVLAEARTRHPETTTIEANESVITPSRGVASEGDQKTSVDQTSAPRAVTRYVVKKGDVYGTISQKVYGTAKHWKLIKKRNEGKGGRKLTPGRRLVIPQLDEGVHLVKDSVASVAAANQRRSLIVDPKSIPIPVMAPTPSAGAAAPEEPVPAATSPIGIDYSKWSGALSFLPNTGDIDTTGGGFSTDLPLRPGIGLALEGARHWQGISLYARWESLRQQYGALPGLAPNSSTVYRHRLRLYAESKAYSGIKLRGGLDHLIRRATQTVPRVLVTNASMQSLYFGLKRNWPGGTLPPLETTLDLLLGFRLRERDVASGSFRSAIGAELTQLAQFQLAGESVAAGLGVRWEKRFFSGVGSRGTIDARESELSFFLPLQWRF